MLLLLRIFWGREDGESLMQDNMAECRLDFSLIAIRHGSLVLCI
jgi:hypothetical protein